MPAVLETRLDRIIHEYRQKGKLKAHGFKHRRKILLAGSPGTGKTMTARVLSHELGLKLNTITESELVAHHISRNGIYLEFKGNPGYDLATKGLEDMRSKKVRLALK